MNKKHLVIQGPTLSIGRTGKNYVGYDPKTFVHYNCIDNINRLIKDFGHLFDTIVISTWDTEQITLNQISTESQNVKLLKLAETALNDGADKLPKGMNIYKQFFSTLEGVLSIDHISDTDIVFKIRTDQYLDLERVIQEYHPERINIPSVDETNAMSDFYIVSSAKRMKELCLSILNFREVSALSGLFLDVHRLMFLGLFYQSKGIEIASSLDYYFLRSFSKWIKFSNGKIISNCKQGHDVETFIGENYHVLPVDILKQLEWRGETFVPLESKTLHSSVTTRSTASINIFNRYIYTNPSKYPKQMKYSLRSVMSALFFILTKFLVQR